MLRKFVMVAAALAAATTLLSCGRAGPRAIDPVDLAPDEVGEWTATAPAQVFEGDDLFELINGGAEIYHEFGFRRALSRDYADAHQRVVALEVFEMTDPHAAFGIYSHKIGENGFPLDLGSGAMLEGYYLNLYGGNFLVTVTGMTDDEVTTDGILRIAESAAEILPRDDDPPPLVDSLQATEPPPIRVFYLRGTLATAAVVPFAVDLQIDMIEGAAARFDDHEELILRCTDPGEARLQLANAVSALEDRLDWNLIDEEPRVWAELEDDEGNQMRLVVEGAKIVMIVADQAVHADTAFERLRRGLEDPATTPH